jgi:hypothetical protein
MGERISENPPPPFEQKPEEEKREGESFEERLRLWREKVAEITDTLGHGIDKEIRETVAVLNAGGFPTLGSCEGHLDWGLAVPWVEIGYAEQPPRYENENQIYAEVARQFNLSAEQVREGASREAFLAAQQKLEQQPETQAWREWVERNRTLLTRMLRLLRAYHAERGKVPEEAKINIQGSAEGVFRLFCGTPAEIVPPEVRKIQKLPEPPQPSADLLARRQAEMKRFTDFLAKHWAKEQK